MYVDQLPSCHLESEVCPEMMAEKFTGDAEVRDRAGGGSDSCEAAVYGGTSGRRRSRPDPWS